MSDLLNINEELKKLKYHIQRVNRCSECLELVEKEFKEKQQNNKMNIMIVLSTVYVVAMVCLNVIKYYNDKDGNIGNGIFIVLGIMATVLLFVLTTSFLTKRMKYVGTICMVAVALASLIPVLSDYYYNSEITEKIYFAISPVISIPVILIAWVLAIYGDRSRNGRLKKIWEEIREV